VKNLLVFAALVFGEELFVSSSLATACLAFVAFCIASSSVYVVNDLVDAERDRLHPDKRHRPIASGQVPQGTALVLAALLSVAALGLSFWVGVGFGSVVVSYILLTHFYSFVGKNIVIVDVLLISMGFVLRAVAGALAIHVPYSGWFVLCTLFVALFIAISKRKAELFAAGEGVERNARPVLSQYTEHALTAFTGASMAAAIISYSLYVLDETNSEVRLLALTVPFVIFAIFRYYLLVDTGSLGEKPEEIFLRDRPFQLGVLGFGLVAVAALYGVG
jgi:4-hydroxybenzoate polyprenyltransferase